MEVSGAVSTTSASFRPTKDYTIAFGRVTPVKNKPRDNAKHTVDEEGKTSKAYKSKPLSLKRAIPVSTGKTDVAGDPYSNSRRPRIFPTKQLELQNKNLRPSSIPRRKPTPNKNVPSKIQKPTVKLPQQSNVQRLEICDTPPDIEEKSETVGATKPIPTLGHIYEGMFTFSSDIFNDYFLASVNGNMGLMITRNVTSLKEDQINTNSTDINFSEGADTSVPQTSAIAKKRSFKTTEENIKDWLSSELEVPTRDNENDYHANYSSNTESECSKEKPGYNRRDDILRKYSSIFNKRRAKSDRRSHASLDKSYRAIDAPNETSVADNKSTLKSKTRELVRPLPKIYSETKQFNARNPYRFYTTLKYPSTPNPTLSREKNVSLPVSSYVDCPSEVIQKTTNFEIEVRDTFSSICENDIHDELSSQALCEHVSGETTDQNDVSRFPSSQTSAQTLKLSKEFAVKDGFWNCKDACPKRSSDLSYSKLTGRCSYHEYYYHYCWRREVARREKEGLRDYKGRCKKCMKYRRCSFRRDKISKKFVILAKPLSIGRVCRHRWNHVWKKTAARFASWSKSPSKLTKRKNVLLMQNLQRCQWDSTDVQTAVLAYHETGTDALTKLQGSVEIATSNCSEKNQKRKVSTSCSPPHIYKTKHVNVGPSRFPLAAITVQPMISEAISAQTPGGIHQDITQHRKELAISETVITEIADCPKIEEYTTTRDHVTKATSHLNFVVLQVDCSTEPVTLSKPEETSADLANVSNDSQSIGTSNTTAGVNATDIEDDPSFLPSNKISTGTVTLDSIYQDTKPSVVTDTIIPYRRLESKGYSKVITPNGTILSCTGTKITSVSSVNLLAGSVPHKANSKFTEVGTYLGTKTVDCFTAPSLYRRLVKDIGLGSVDKIISCDESTSVTDMEKNNNSSIGLSTTNLTEMASINCGSHLSLHSFNAEIQPESRSQQIDAVLETKSQSMFMSQNSFLMDKVEVIEGKEDTIKGRDIGTCCDQEKLNGSPNATDSGRIGRSCLMSVQMLGNSVTEAGTQDQIITSDAETLTIPKTFVSSSNITSFSTMIKPPLTEMEHEDISSTERCEAFEKPVSPTNTRLRKCTSGKPSPTQMMRRDDAKEISKLSPELTSTLNLASRISVFKSSPTQVMHQDTVNDKLKLAPKVSYSKSSKCVEAMRNPSVVISSNINAAKWMKGCPKDYEKDYQSVINISEMTVSESLQRASLALANSNAIRLSRNFIENNKKAAVNCMTTKPLGVVSTTELPDAYPKNMNDDVFVTNVQATNKEPDYDKTDESGKALEESTTQEHPNFGDASINCKLPILVRKRSASVLTSRHILAQTPCCDNVKGTNECIYVYDHVRCIIHEKRVNKGTQMDSNVIHNSTPKAKQDIRNIGFMTSFPRSSCCHAKRTGGVISKVSSPQVNGSSSTASISCHHDSHVLAKNIDWMKHNFKRHFSPSVGCDEKEVHQINSNTYTEACTMKPSGRQDKQCQVTKSKPPANIEKRKSSRILAPAMNTTNFSAKDRYDLKNVYSLLSAIEGRIRRLKLDN
ncbi:uncharacterized protein LOC126972675 isoform X3 [Leptidea sinapis]|uniref:uncharacterized protein LOC126972675 isoform X3 n=1 Tax=Leptidea sinapis TaxID=189913 RepID=UPI0021C25658|nr:uncharacterized protein LOC126972675 isoform X3 [Leptidea sinapis]